MSKYKIEKKRGAALEGSQLYMSKKEGIPVEETWLYIERIVLCDTSFSMIETDSRDNLSRYTVLCIELENLQKAAPGKIAVYTFSDKVEWCPDGKPKFLKMSTDIAGALQYLLDRGINKMKIPVSLISDGEPDNENSAYEVAEKYEVPIDTVYVGGKDEYTIAFMKKISDITHGVFEKNLQMKQKHLADTIVGLLPG